MRCSRCGQELSGGAPAARPALASPKIADDWELEADLRGVERLVGSLKRSGFSGSAASQSQPHAARESAASWHGRERPAAADNVDDEQQRERPKSYLLAWALLSLGLATFACGAVLLGWSFAAERDDLWPLGLPLALIGQAGLIVGLILQLDGLWSSNRQTAKTLSELDDELSRVRHATTLLTTTKHTSAQSFYAHMAEGASPQLLLADLKGQLDLLAQQMSSQRR